MNLPYADEIASTSIYIGSEQPTYEEKFNKKKEATKDEELLEPIVDIVTVTPKQKFQRKVMVQGAKSFSVALQKPAGMQSH